MADNETTADVIAAMRDEAARADMEQECSIDDAASAAKMMREFARRLEAAHKREMRDAVTGSNQLRDALDKARRFIDSSPLASIVDDTGTIARGELCAEIDAALAAPPRNCDVYTADELKAIFKSELVSELPIANEHERNLITITAMRMIDTLFATATEKEGGNYAD